ncbi:hypothetical protein SELMODRAFT_417984 [Selaginella moellendorffii]|uniref:Uncharacterized protein n=1 Tax=Selaginella moellendorffii TaxID=88036 RepID=D8S4A5_SELML|nr:hypothetical protein SELMODRAFT_417984 [Selaginella moellendorffii]
MYSVMCGDVSAGLAGPVYMDFACDITVLQAGLYRNALGKARRVNTVSGVNTIFGNPFEVALVFFKMLPGWADNLCVSSRLWRINIYCARKDFMHARNGLAELKWLNKSGKLCQSSIGMGLTKSFRSTLPTIIFDESFVARKKVIALPCAPPAPRQSYCPLKIRLISIEKSF